jgi:hypothetical protein
VLLLQIKSVHFIHCVFLSPDVLPYSLRFLVAEAKTELAEPGAEHEGPAAQEHIAHVAHVSLEVLGDIGETGSVVRALHTVFGIPLNASEEPEWLGPAQAGAAVLNLEIS